MKKLLMILALAVSACGPTMDVPGGFVRVDGEYDLRVTNADGVVVGVNTYRNRRPNGDLGFWAAALDARVRARYGATQRVEIATNSGVEGIQIRAATARDGRPHRYWATVFVTGRNVVLVEAGGDEAHFAPHEEDVLAAIQSLDI